MASERATDRVIVLGNCTHWWHEPVDDHPLLISPGVCPTCGPVPVAFVEVASVLVAADLSEASP